MLILLVFAFILGLVCWSLFKQPKRTIWEKKDHVWYSRVRSSYMVSRKYLNIGAYSLKGRKYPQGLDNAEASGDQRCGREKETAVVPHASELGATQRYNFVIPVVKSVNTLENLSSTDSQSEIEAAAQRLLSKYDSDFSRTYLDPVLPSRMKSVENTEDFRLVSSLARAKNESWSKPSGVCSEKPAIQHIRGVRRRLD